jgi:hypothetical protein
VSSLPRDPKWFRPYEDRGTLPADVTLREKHEIQEENHQLWLGIVKAWEYIKGSRKATRADTLSYLEDVLAAYGTRAKYQEAEFENGVDARFQTTIKSSEARDRMGVFVPENRRVRMLVEYLEGVPSAPTIEIVKAMHSMRTFTFKRSRSGHYLEIDSLLRRFKKIFRVDHWVPRKEGGRLNYWSLTWM